MYECKYVLKKYFHKYVLRNVTENENRKEVIKRKKRKVREKMNNT